VEPEHRSPSRNAWLLLRRLSVTGLTLLLAGVLIWLLFSLRHQVPLVGGLASTYRPPLGPLPLAGEDRLLLAGLANGRTSVFEPPSVIWRDASERLPGGTPAEITAAVADLLAGLRPGGPGRDMVIVYLKMLGTLDATGQPCLIPPAASGAVAAGGDGLLPLESLVGELRSRLADSTGLLLVLDGQSLGAGWPLGLADGSFPTAVESWLDSRQPSRTWVFLSRSSGERVHGDLRQGGSLFARCFTAGLRGAADTAGDGDGTISLGELTDFVRRQVHRRARLQFGSPQTPLLIPAASERLAADNPPLAWSAQGGLLGRWLGGGPDAEADLLAPPAAAGPPAPTGTRLTGWLRDRWLAADRLRPRAVHAEPLLWQQYQQLLVRSEQLQRSGTAYDRQLAAVETLAERLELRLAALRFTDPERLPALAIDTGSGLAAEDQAGADATWQASMAQRLAALAAPAAPAAAAPAASSDPEPAAEQSAPNGRQRTAEKPAEKQDKPAAEQPDSKPAAKENSPVGEKAAGDTAGSATSAGDAAGGEAAPAAPPPGLPPAAAQAEWLARGRAAVGWLDRFQPGPQPPPQTLLAEWLANLGPAPTGRTPDPVQIHAARMIDRWVDARTWQLAGDLPLRLLQLIGQSRRVAYPADVRVDRVIELSADRHAIDLKLRRACDLLFLGTPPALGEVEQLAAAIAPAYAELEELAAVASEAIRFSDRLHDELPWLTSWAVAEARAARQADADDQPPSGRPDANVDWRALIDASFQFDQAIHDVFRSAEGKTQRETARGAIDSLREARQLIGEPFDRLVEAFTATCDRLANAAPQAPGTVAGIERVLATPLVRGQRRLALLRRAEAARNQLLAAPISAGPDEPATVAPEAAAVAGWIEWRDSLLHPLVPILAGERGGVLAAPSQHSVAAASVGQQLDIVRRAVARLPEQLASYREQEAVADSTTVPGGGSERSFLESGEFLARRLAVLACHRDTAGTTSSARASLVAAWHDRLVAAASDCLDDYYAGIEPDDPVWCLRAAGLFLEGADELLRRTRVTHASAARRAVERRLARLPAGGGVGSVATSPETLTLLPADIAAAAPPLRTTIEPDAGVPPGVASVWFARSLDGKPLAIARPVQPTGLTGPAAAAAAALRLPLELTQPAAAGLMWTAVATGQQQLGRLADRDTGRGVIDQIVWFRGHRVVAPLPVLTASSVRTVRWNSRPPARPAVVVKGDVERNRSVAIVFDCSGSMGERLPDRRTRLEAGREAVAEILGIMAREGGWNASLWLYGHRTRWTRDRRGRFQAGLTAEGERQRDAAVADGGGFRLLPGDDVERVLDMQPLSPLSVLQFRTVLDRQQPGGETPLYRAIAEAIRVDLGGREPGPAHVVVVTDGANDQTGGTITSSGDVRRILAEANFRRDKADQIRVDVIGFNLQPGGYDREMRLQDLQSLARDSDGTFFDAADPRRLAAALRQSMRIIRWQVTGGAGGPSDAAIGEPVVLPLPLPGQPETYDIQLETGGATRRVTLRGDEALELFIGGRGSRLAFGRYTGGFEQGLRDSHDNLPDPFNPTRRWFIGAHLARREGRRVELPLSVQNGQADEFSPRPVEIWVEVTPCDDRGPVGLPYVFTDLAIQPGRPVPVLSLAADDWPAEATAARIRPWVRFVASEPVVRLPVAQLVPGREERFNVPRQRGVSIRCRLARQTAVDRIRLTVIEEHPAAVAGQLPLLRVAVGPGCLQAVHLIEPGTGRVRHEFDLPLIDGQLAGDLELTVTDRQTLLAGAVGPAVLGGPVEPLVVPVPPQ